MTGCFRRARRGATITGQPERRRTRMVTLPSRRVASSPRRGRPSTMRSASKASASRSMASAIRSTIACLTFPPAATPDMRSSKMADSAT